MSSEPSLPDLLAYLGSFALVVALLLSVLFALKQLHKGTFSLRRGTRIELIEAMSVAPKAKVALVRIGSREFLLGVTPNRVCRISEWYAEELMEEIAASTSREQGERPRRRQ